MREIIKLPVAYRHTGFIPLRGSLRAAPIAMSVAGQEYHNHLCRSWPYREPPDSYSRELPLPAKQIEAVLQIMAQPLMWLVRSSRTAKATCLMNAYSVFKVLVKGFIKSPFT